ncbi:ABC-type transport auxiliary lipoprotein family protein [Vibrio alfacsensis]|uniref:PqiC family protein n=1 Tax=Vibrio alfacsensis TaxID=1074311 RepID=UPI002ADE1C1C|nr:ABC-type transport auxiliary lipoprotein family protein [Vibrio alfacsensis]WQE77135.1 ABC-type transport auxiliary lipoprotein family protein [Vibrio alfacsensis]
MKRGLLLISALLAGCSSAPENSNALYVLPEASSVTINDSVIAQRPQLVVRPVVLASYLADSGIVYRTSETQIIQAKHNQWAHSISEQITQRVINELRGKQSQYWPVEVNNLLDQTSENKLQLTLSKFNGSYDGNAEIEGEWLLIDANGKAKSSAPIKISMPLQDEGYDALVDALSIGLNNLTDQIATQL